MEAGAFRPPKQSQLNQGFRVCVKTKNQGTGVVWDGWLKNPYKATPKLNSRVKLNPIAANPNSLRTFHKPRNPNPSHPRCSFKVPNAGSTIPFCLRYTSAGTGLGIPTSAFPFVYLCLLNRFIKECRVKDLPGGTPGFYRSRIYQISAPLSDSAPFE